MKFNVIITNKCYRPIGPQSGAVRVVDVPNDELTDYVNHNLERIFYYGQNDFQPANVPSVSVGDIVLYRDPFIERFEVDFYLVNSIGWTKLEPVKSNEYQTTPTV
jgi:hypothetical protein